MTDGSINNDGAALKKNKERFEAEMAEIGSVREMQTKEAEIEGRITGLERKLQVAELEKVLRELRSVTVLHVNFLYNC